jgi:hypothetical protein
VTTAKAKGDQIQRPLEDLVEQGPIGMIISSPKLGGNGDDGGLQAAMDTDPDVTALAGIAHALDASRSRVPTPHPDGPSLPMWPLAPVVPVQPGTPTDPGGSAGDPGVPVEPLPVEVPLVPLAFTMGSRRPTTPGDYPDPDPTIPYARPYPPPVPREPGFPPLTPAQRKAFDTWAASVPDKGFANRQGMGNLDNAYQYRVSGYPEKLLTAKAGGGTGGYISADGLRDTDGMVVEAKRVRNPNVCDTPRVLSTYLNAKPWHAGVYLDDSKELDKYREALVYGPNKGHLRGVEICTNDRDSVDYWNAMMIARGVHGYARYAP